MKKLQDSMGKYIVCLGELAVGIVILINPESFTKFVLMAAGVLFCVLGVLAAISYFRMDPAEAALSQELVRGLVELAVGAILIYRAEWITENLKYISVIYGVAAIFVGFVKLQWTVDMARLKTGMWQTGAISALLSLVLGVVVLVNAQKALWVFTGVALIVTAVTTFLSAVLKPSGKDKDVPASEN